MGAWIAIGTTKENAQPVAYDSRSFNSAQRNYSTHELELLAIVDPHDRWRPFLYCIPVYVFRLNGVIGNGEALLGHTELSVTLGGVTTDHIFWIGESVATLILGSPFILKNKVEVVWASDNRRLLRQKSASGVTEQWVDGPNGIRKTYYDPQNPWYSSVCFHRSLYARMILRST